MERFKVIRVLNSEELEKELNNLDYIQYDVCKMSVIHWDEDSEDVIYVIMKRK